MNRHRPEVADVFRSHGRAFEEAHGACLSAEQRRVLRDLVDCRTRALGGHKLRCEACGHERIAYNSCRNRHCPKCQTADRAEWFRARERELLEVAYFHVVLTLPAGLGLLALYNPRVVYGLLFRAAAGALLAAARDPRHVGGEIGVLAVLHTWGQNLQHHPHLHCLIPGGGLSRDGRRWIACRKNFFLPVRVISRLFRGKFLADLKKLRARGQLRLPEELATAARWTDWLGELRAGDWVVYVKPPFAGPATVLKYLARYTHRVAISNERLLAVQGGRVSFLWKDYAQGGCRRTMTLDAVEFIRRFLLHVLPKGFVRIRYFGFLAHRHRNLKLPLVQKLLRATGRGPSSEATAPSPRATQAPEDDRCPQCGRGRLVMVERLEPIRWPAVAACRLDSS